MPSRIDRPKINISFDNYCNKCGCLLNDGNWCKTYRRCFSCRAEVARNRRHTDPFARQKSRERVAQWRKKKAPEYKRDKQLQFKYGITYDQYKRILESQGGVCLICRRLNSIDGQIWSPLHVDHNHETGKVRGLLCQRCNTALGKIDENIETLERMKLYLTGKLNGNS